MPRGYISLGSNIDKQKNVISALDSLATQFNKLIVSSTFESGAIGFSGEPFYNLVIGFDSDLEVKSVAKILRQIEEDHGRTRSCKKFSSRTLDLDLILYGYLVISDGRLQIPRNEIELYAFVLEPLAEIAPDLKHPVSHKSYAELWHDFDKSNLKQYRIDTLQTKKIS
jgi:2-amino-4-hydroxy-6-hydroxymethyldihydropteridine diphosphokinase